ncbi:T9SS type A sorting domain-containing protein [Chryseobacterium nematophagum]|nr:T9SS type A sorting domain-containing protein [Chryseobacterium nematophagum]
MAKKFSMDKSFTSGFLSRSLVLGTFLGVCSLQAQLCGNTADINTSGTISIGNVQVSSSSSGSVLYEIAANFFDACNLGATLSSGSALRVGSNGSWSVTFSFSVPVNNVRIVISGADTFARHEDFIFNTNGGSASIIPGGSCGMGINGNTITAIGTLGAGVYIINSSPYTQLTVSGGGGSGGSVIGVCSSSVLENQEIKNLKNDVVDIYPSQVKDMMTISSKETLKSYKIFDESGKLILSAALGSNKKEINLSGIMPGSYIVAIETKTKTINKKIIKH